MPQRRPRPRQTEIGDRRRLAVMLTMALGSFAIGTTEFVSMGLLNTIAEDFQISENEAGVIISAYAIGVVVGAPIDHGLYRAGPTPPTTAVTDGCVYARQRALGGSRHVRDADRCPVCRRLAPRGIFFSRGSIGCLHG